jgi:serine O-acetyltransferase
MRQTMAADLARYTDGRPTPLVYLRTAAGEPGLVATTLLRVQQAAVARRWLRTAKVARQLALAVTGADFVPGCEAGPGLRLSHPHGVVLGGRARLGTNVTLLQNVTLGERYADGRPPHDCPRLDDDVTVGAGACVLGGVTVGRGATIGANSVVLADVPSGGVAVGSPARVLDGTDTGIGS